MGKQSLPCHSHHWVSMPGQETLGYHGRRHNLCTVEKVCVMSYFPHAVSPRLQLCFLSLFSFPGGQVLSRPSASHIFSVCMRKTLEDRWRSIRVRKRERPEFMSCMKPKNNSVRFWRYIALCTWLTRLITYVTKKLILKWSSKPNQTGPFHTLTTC